jgi:hypothetical protein
MSLQKPLLEVDSDVSQRDDNDVYVELSPETKGRTFLAPHGEADPVTATAVPMSAGEIDSDYIGAEHEEIARLNALFPPQDAQIQHDGRHPAVSEAEHNSWGAVIGREPDNHVNETAATTSIDSDSVSDSKATIFDHDAGIVGKDNMPSDEIGQSSKDKNNAIRRRFSVSEVFEQLNQKQEIQVPFQRPSVWNYVVMVLSAFASFALPVYTLYLTILDLDTALDSTDGYFIVYVLAQNFPLYTGLILLYATVNHVALQYLYYTFMSYGLLVQFKKTPLYKKFFFYFMLVITTIFVLVEYHFTKSINKAMSIIVLQCAQLLFFYNSTIINAEDTLVSLNKYVKKEPGRARQVLSGSIIIHQDRLREAVCEQLQKLRVVKQRNYCTFLFGGCCETAAYKKIIQDNRVDMWKLRSTIIAKLRTGKPPAEPNFAVKGMWAFKFLSSYKFLPPRDRRMGKVLISTLSLLSLVFSIGQSVVSVSRSLSYSSDTGSP